MSAFNADQVEQLLKPIAKQRVLSDGKGHSHVSQQDVTAHLIRVFGFGSFDTEIVSLDCIFERQRMKDGKPVIDRYDVCYKAVLRLTVRDDGGQRVCQFEDGSTATAQNQTLGDAHDLAMKSAISLAKKRAAINLGDQFGLSLYNKGQTDALVRGTLVKPQGDAGEDGEPEPDVQVGVPQQVSFGNDETDYESGSMQSMESEPDWSPLDAQRFQELIDGASTAEELNVIAADIAASSIQGPSRDDLRRKFSEKMKLVSA